MPEDPPHSPSEPPETWQESIREVSPYLGLGMQLALGLVFFVGAGYGLDQWLGTTPWFLIGGALLGMVADFIYLVRVSNTLGQKSDARKTSGPPSSEG